jgi:hypothetical protein
MLSLFVDFNYYLSLDFRNHRNERIQLVWCIFVDVTRHVISFGKTKRIHKRLSMLLSTVSISFIILLEIFKHEEQLLSCLPVEHTFKHIIVERRMDEHDDIRAFHRPVSRDEHTHSKDSFVFVSFGIENDTPGKDLQVSDKYVLSTITSNENVFRW